MAARCRGGKIELVDAQDLPQLDAQIQRDLQLLKAQRDIVRQAEGKIVSDALVPRKRREGRAAGYVPTVSVQRKFLGSIGEGSRRQRLQGVDEESEKNNFKWESRQVDHHLGDMVRSAQLESKNGYEDQQVKDWGDFFDHLNTKVDVPKYGKKDLVVDNIEAIPACNQDCDKPGTSNDEDFWWYDTLNRVNKDSHIVDNLRDITACTIDC